MIASARSEELRIDPKVDVYMDAVIDTFTAGRTNVEEAMQVMEKEMKKRRGELQQIQLLALRRYLRFAVRASRGSGPGRPRKCWHWLHDYVPLKEPTSAAPGTSDHGQMHAVDFVVMQGATTIAGTETTKIGSDWKATGLEKKLKAATENTPGSLLLGKPVLQGPLKHPYEPWHYALPKGSKKRH